jgi:hypothetical protein
VIAGFVAGTGFLVVSGSVEIGTGRRLDLSVLDAVRHSHPVAIATAVAVALLFVLVQVREVWLHHGKSQRNSPGPPVPQVRSRETPA